MKRVVSVSLGSSKRDKTSTVNILGEEFEISRIGTDGDMVRFAQMMQELDGKVDAIGLGGIDRYLWVDDRKYTIKEADRLARIAVKTPVVDGSGVKNTVERRIIEYLQENNIVDFPNSKVFMVCATDRFGMAQTIAKLCGNVVYGDLMFSTGIPIPLRSYRSIRILATLLLPIFIRLPFKWIYPTGPSQDVTIPKYGGLYDWADIIAGDYLIIKRSLPTAESGYLKGKIVISNTVTQDDTQMLKDRGVKMLITGTPEYDGRFYATNVLESIMITLLGKRVDEVTKKDYEDLLVRMNWKPTIARLTE